MKRSTLVLLPTAAAAVLGLGPAGTASADTGEAPQWCWTVVRTRLAA